MRKFKEILSETTSYSIAELNKRITEPIIKPFDCYIAFEKAIKEYPKSKLNNNIYCECEIVRGTFELSTGEICCCKCEKEIR